MLHSVVHAVCWEFWFEFDDTRHKALMPGVSNAAVAPVLESATVPGGATDGDCITVCTVDCELLGHASSWVGANFDPGALRSLRELLSQPMYFNESFLQCELLGHFWHRPMNFLGRGGSWVVTHAIPAFVHLAGWALPRSRGRLRGCLMDDIESIHHLTRSH